MKTKDEIKTIEIFIKDIKNETNRERIKQILEWNIRKAEKYKKFHYIFAIITLTLNNLIPVFNIFGWNRMGTTLVSALLNISVGIPLIYSFKDSWGRYRKSVEEIKTECIKFSNDLEDYNGNEKEKILMLNIEKINRQERETWIKTKIESKERK